MLHFTAYEIASHQQMHRFTSMQGCDSISTKRSMLEHNVSKDLMWSCLHPYCLAGTHARIAKMTSLLVTMLHPFLVHKIVPGYTGFQGIFLHEFDTYHHVLTFFSQKLNPFNLRWRVGKGLHQNSFRIILDTL